MHVATFLVIGDRQYADFQAVTAWLAARDVTYSESCAQAVELLRNGATRPGWILLLAAHRGAFEQRLVERLHRAAPLARLVTVLGSWCEGETRSGRALAGVARVYWHQFTARANAALRASDDFAGWSLPRTATPLDVALHARQAKATISPVQIAIMADRRADYEALAEGITACGAAPIRCLPFQQTPTAVGYLWCGQSLNERTIPALGTAVTRAGGQPLIALLDFPRADETVAALERGAAGVLSKPFLLGDLRAELARLGLMKPAAPARRAG
jgi:hypothetical protein